MTLAQLPEKNYSLTSGLFKINYPNLTFVHAILEGRLPGEVWVDEIANPSACLVMSKGDLCFIAGNFNEVLFKSFYKQLKIKPLVRLVCEPDSQQSLIPFDDYGFTPLSRLQFEYPDAKIALPDSEKLASFKLVPIDENTLHQCTTYPLAKILYETDENCLAFGSGYGLWDKAKELMACEALAVCSNKYAELSVFTHPAYRQQGLAKLVCTRLLWALLQAGYYPLWTCDTANRPSLLLAEALGMKATQEYQFQILKQH